MKLPAPYWLRKPIEGGGKKVPLLYGVTPAAGSFTVTLLRLSGLGPIIGGAGRAQQALVGCAIGYRDGEDALVAAVEEVLRREGLDSKIQNVVDTISENGSLEPSLQFVDSNGDVVSTVLPTTLFIEDKENFKYPPDVRVINSSVPLVGSAYRDFGHL